MKIIKDNQRLIIVFNELDSKKINEIARKIKSLKFDNGQSIRIFKDVDKLTIVIDNNVDKVKNEIFSILKEYCEEFPEVDVIKYLKPIKTDFEKNSRTEVIDLKQKIVKYNKNMKLPKMMPYSGMTPFDALEKDGINALVAICLKEHLMDPQIYKMTLKCIEVTFREFLEEKYSNLDIESIEISEIKSFIVSVEQVLPESVEQILNKATFSSIESFIKYGNDLELRSAYATLMDKLIKKFK